MDLVESDSIQVSRDRDILAAALTRLARWAG